MTKFIPSSLLMLQIAAVLIVAGVLIGEFMLVRLGSGMTIASILVILVASITERKSND